MKRDHIGIIRAALPHEELLAHAAHKLRRAYMGINPTPVEPGEAYEALMEELADVRNCIAVLDYDRGVDKLHISRIASQKMQRWANRLEEARKQC